MTNYIGVPYINQVSPQFVKEDFNGDGSTTDFTLTNEVPGGNEENLHVVLDNVVQEPTVAYTVEQDGNSQFKVLRFSEAPSSSATIYVVHRGIGTSNFIPSSGSVTSTSLSDNLKSFTTDTFTGDGSTTAFTLSETPPNANSILVTVDGIVQKVTTNYTLATTTLTFTSAPDASAEIEVKHMGVRGFVRRGPDYQIDTFTGDGSTTGYTLSNAVSTNNAFVFYNGVALVPTTDYSINSSTGVMTFTFAPVASSSIMVRYQL